mgnify:CR=1 FL=1|jgi:hypothetical protein
MSKSRPISDFIDTEVNGPNLVEGILNNIEAPVIETNIDNEQKQEQMIMEENMARQIEEQQRFEQEDEHEEQYYHQDPNHQHQYQQQYQPPPPPQVNKEEPPPEKSLLDKILENLKPAILVIILSSCVFSNLSTKFIEKILPDKEIFNKYNIIIVLLIKSLLSGIIFFISNLLL